MTRKIIAYYSSDCPYTNQEQTVKITYEEISPLHSSSKKYTIVSFSCPYGNECPYPSQSHTEYCPVVDSAPEPPC